MKRRRIDGPVTANQIAESNRTLQILAGRHNRWMTGHTISSTHGEEDGQTATTGVEAVTAAATHSSGNRPTATATSLVDSTQSEAGTDAAPSTNGMSNGGGAQPVQERPASTASTSNARAPAPPPTRTPSAGPNLVQYEAPPSAVNEFTRTAFPTPATSNGRKSVDMMAWQTAQPSLPSPASSDDSPTFAAQALRRAAPPRNSIGAIATTRSSVVNSPLAPHQPSPLQHHMHVPMPGPGHPYQTSPIPQQAAHVGQLQSPMLQQQQHQHYQGQQSHRHSLPNGVQAQQIQGQGQPLRTPPILPSNGPTARQLAASRIPAHALLAQLDAKEAEMKQAGTLSPTDSGRIALLREAVQKNDWFYQVLSQLFCLRSANPMMLPQSVQDANNKCWDYLDVLICPNNTLNRGLVEFFAQFPESIMAIYSDRTDARDIYDMRVQAVKACLNKLPEHWDNFVRACKKMWAPPLVQDLHDILYLKTPVLQSTAFRAIARMLYGSAELDFKGVQAIERVHLLDQDYFYRYNHRRSPAEMKKAYSVLTSVFQSFQVWKQHFQDRAPNQRLPDFALTQSAAEFFQRLPPGVAPTQQPPAHAHRGSLQSAQILAIQQHPQLQQQQITHQQNQQQQQRVQAQFQAPSGRSSPMQQQNMVQMPAQLAELQALGARLQAGRAGMQSPATPMQNQGPRRIFPRAEEQPRPQPTNPDWTRSGLHQSHLRSPHLGPIEAKPGAPRLYRYVIGFGVPPTRLKKTVFTETIKFSITQKAMERIAKTDAPQSKGGSTYRHISETSLLYRLRCSAIPGGGLRNEAVWVIADNVWPDDMYFELNGTKLETRRKLHHGRYLPVDLTALLRLGENRLRVSRSRTKNDFKFRTPQYALAVEVIGVTTHDKIKGTIPRISATDSLAAIKKSLSGGDGDDDDLAVTSSALTIKLFDPYSGCKIFDIPARGKDCLHRDCFDLETFLEMCKRQHPGWPTVVDCWRCPLCRGDVRPQTLVVDEFLVQIREELEKQGLLNTREIVVNADGSWKPKAEERTGVRSPSLEREERGSMARSVSAAAPAPAPVEVIEID
ncbi:hypothetical protein PRZ48_005106 [Zasmidium cellare]|uniref:SP-RING-type domain-containing protein n=1 Tax=Zasmidium cellare TaxID=395010 RepID=A0ABR0ESF6_ZASCE|nr:hypothetical protein PRZ48_005106 [Zasmidium cellare]